MAGESPLKRKRRALLSVTDKQELETIVEILASYEYELIASGGTAAYVREHGFDVTEVADLTGYPAIFGGRVKTLHPIVHGGILGPDEEAFEGTKDLGVEPIDVVCVNLYEFEKTVEGGGTEAEIVEKIDIGGPALLRAAAKNFKRVAVLSDPEQYEDFLAELRHNDGWTTKEYRRKLAVEAFSLVAHYNAAITDWMADEPAGDAAMILRYGENPHQGGQVELPADPEGELAGCGLKIWNGKALSYNNFVDLIASLKLVLEFEDSCCGVIKHTNPCGFGMGQPVQALEKALLCDPISAFGGIFAFNRKIDMQTAEVLRKRFLEIIVAPEFDADALKVLKKKKNVRVLTCDGPKFIEATRGQGRSFGRVLLSQDEDEGFPELDDWKLAAGPHPDEKKLRDLELAWKVCKHTKSNAIVLAGDSAILGVGAGQMSRVDSVKLSISKAREQELDLADGVAASDAFFPFPDGIEALAAAGINAVMTPGGSIRDEEVAEAAEKLGVTLIFTSRRHFRH